jgi:hypothetical protein
LNIILPSTKFIQCQIVSRSTLKASINDDINKLSSITSTNKNIQHDIYIKIYTKDVLKSFRNDKEQRLQNHLISQGSFFSSLKYHQNLHVIIQFLMVIRSIQTS